MMPDSCVLRVDRKQSKRDAESSPTENSSLNKYTNLDPCCYGNLLMEFHHQSNLYSATVRRTPPSHPLADCSHTVLWLVTCSLSANLLSSSRLISSSLRWGPFSCCLTISLSFLCCWERMMTGRKRNEHRCNACTGEFIMDSLRINWTLPRFVCKELEKEIKGAGV